MLKSRNLIQPEDFSVKEIDEILNLAEDIMQSPSAYSRVCEGKLMATLFYEPSTRTRLSFEAAMKRLGGEIIGFSEPNSSSVSKGESLGDTMRVVSGYVDLIVMRHPVAGAAEEATKYTSVPFINAGDGGNQHPTQTLTDLLTIKSLKGTLSNHTIGLCGDLKYGRTVHSLVKAMTRYEDNRFVFISPEELSMPEYIKEKIKSYSYCETSHLDESLKKLDLLYMTRIQRERFADSDEYERLKDSYILDKEKMDNAKEDMLVMHPLPRVNEISIDVDDDERAVYFKQATYGMYVRMALIIKLLGVDIKN
ncbi:MULTISPECIES: aspartate carbamoyltransferase [Terrisporobacter]|uniref:Aspartate carbamoyltransferase n=1 Tax=Terrisporobacter othiniensis TaxID=1577792 RepID=A0A0B3VZS9_9FIRM|nr:MULTISPECIES: aspartate carbamoyltransferase [Terrisporobacter]KHS55582.1 aspartate carbamoyltransferase catalytic subunit [Terrisporobacter othiniensis]MCC3670914.1 aspartate carbamoyltransferase [Terrisporobacter mayombei]